MCCQKLPGVARGVAKGRQELSGVVRSCQVLPGVAGCFQMLPGAARCCRVFPGIARSCRVLQALPEVGRCCQRSLQCGRPEPSSAIVPPCKIEKKRQNLAPGNIAKCPLESPPRAPTGYNPFFSSYWVTAGLIWGWSIFKLPY